MADLDEHRVPLLILSAGLRDVIEMTLRNQNRLYNNIKIVSNFLDFNHQGVAVGLKGDLIHIFNKNQSAVQNTDYFERQGGRQNIMLLGDSMGDLTMAAGAKGDRNIIKIG